MLINWTWHGTFNVMMTCFIIDYCSMALYFAVQHIMKIIRRKRLERELQLEEKRERLLELASERAAKQKAWRSNPKKKRRNNNNAE